jgi:predicted PurR-regulated permease PerM
MHLMRSAPAVIDHLGRAARAKTLDAVVVDLVVQIACLALVAYWTLILLEPLLSIILWSVILAVLLHPAFDWMVGTLHMRRVLAALVLTALSLVVLIGPATWLGLSLAGTVRTLAERLGSGDIAVPAPPEGVKGWPVLGEQLFDLWFLASTNLGAAFTQIGPQLKPLGTALLGYAGSAGISMLKFMAAVAISGFLLLPGPSMVKSARMIFRRIADRRGDEFVSLAGATVRSLARGVIGVSLLQALLVGVGLMVAGIPAAGLFSFLVLVLGIVQIGPLIVTGPLVIWSWTTMDPAGALIFSAYMLPVTVLDNFLRPFVMAHGLKTPVLVILVGVIGGVLTHGVLGLFVGPIVLAIAWELLTAWAQEEPGALKQP